MGFHWKWQSTQFLWNEGSYVMALFLVREAVVMRSDTQSVFCNVEWDKLGKSFFVDNFYAFKSSNFNVFILRKRIRTPGVFKVYLYHAEFEKKIKIDCYTDKCVFFLEKMKAWSFYFCCSVTMITNNIPCIGICLSQYFQMVPNNVKKAAEYAIHECRIHMVIHSPYLTRYDSCMWFANCLITTKQRVQMVLWSIMMTKCS